MCGKVDGIRRIVRRYVGRVTVMICRLGLRIRAEGWESVSKQNFNLELLVQVGGSYV